MIHFFGLRKMKVWVISSRNFETVVAAPDEQTAVEVFYTYHPKERGDVWEMERAEYERQKQCGGEQRGMYIGGMFHTYIFIKESMDELWVRSEPKVLYSHQDVKAPMGIARQGGEGVMIYMSKIEVEMLDHVIAEVMPTDTRSKMGARMISMLHQFLDGSISRLPINWMDAKRKLTAMKETPRLEKWDPPEQIEAAENNEAFLDPKNRRKKPADLFPQEIKPLKSNPTSPDLAETTTNVKNQVGDMYSDTRTIPCKKCGGEAHITKLPESSTLSHRIYCCAKGMQCAGDSEVAVIKTWNRLNMNTALGHGPVVKALDSVPKIVRISTDAEWEIQPGENLD